MKKETFYAGEGLPYPDPYMNWENHPIGNHLFYSFRDTQYRRETFFSAMHYHEYYEVVVIEQGTIDQLCESETFALRTGDIVIEPPGQMHHSALSAPATRYIRHVFYFQPEVFEAYPRLLDFLERGPLLSAEEPKVLFGLLRQLNEALSLREPAAEALVWGLLLQCFYCLNRAAARKDPPAEPWAAGAVKQYIDEEYAALQTVGEIATHFYYSREYLSRLFRRHYNVTVADYLRSRRILAARPLLQEGIPPSEVCFRVGFGSLSAFNRAFKEELGMTPTEYKKIGK
ncbi:MAG: AraC family transcriptional regulator [Clostridia bacterium]|nr:AraC family transcriptional regulator [Clostridia bacterium]